MPRRRILNMSSKRRTYLPTASIVVGILIVAVVVAVTLFRDIDRGRGQVAALLERQARGAAGGLAAGMLGDLLSSEWQRPRLDFFVAHASQRSDMMYAAIVGGDGTVLVHSEADLVGTPWGGNLDDVEPAPDVAGSGERARGGRGADGDRAAERAPRTAMNSRVIDLGDRRVYEYSTGFDVRPIELCAKMPPFMLRRPMMMQHCSAVEVAARLSELLGRPVRPDESVRLFFVVGLDPGDLEAALLASRNQAVSVALVLFLASGVAIYFLFKMSHYRSTRTALANMRTYTSNVIESMPSGLVSLGPDGRIVTLNPTARRILALGDESVSSRRLDEIVRLTSPDDRRRMENTLSGGKDIVDAETRLETAAGTVPVSLSASSIRDEDGDRSGTVLLFQDLREIEELRDEVERGRHLASLGRLAAGIAHEVRNPLSSLKGFAQIFRSKFVPGSEEERYADIMIEEVERLDRVVQELLDFAKPVLPQKRPSDGDAIVDEALSLVSEDAQFRGVEIVRRPAEGGLPAAMVDPLQMRQALLNVLLNAIEAMEDGGTLTVATRATESAGERRVVIDVTDTGPGISPADREKLFEPFYTTKPSGTGLGLTIVSRVLEQNGVHLDFESEPGSGTTFSFSMEADAGPAAGEGGQ